MHALFLTLLVSSAFGLWPFSKPPLSFYDASTKSVLDSLSLKEKVGQVFMAPVMGKELTQEAHAALHRSKLGNVILYAKINDLTRSYQIRQLTTSIYQTIMDEVRIPPFIAVDEEGGYVHRLQPMTHFPSARAMGICSEAPLVRAAYKAMGLEARALGCNLILAPVLDLHTNHKSTLLGTRAFGEQPDTVAALGKAALKGLEEANVLGCLKHAPGHGATSIDTHVASALCTSSINELTTSHWLPFQQLASLAPAMMSSHVTYQAIDPTQPATFSRDLLQRLIRERWDFHGVLISDSLTMQALDGTSLGERAVRAFKAGCDCCLFGPIEPATSSEAIDAIERAMDYFLRAVQSGEIALERLDASITRILKMKEQIPVTPAPPIDTAAHLALSQTIAEKSLTLLSSRELFDSIDTSLFGKRIILLIPQTLAMGLEKILSALQFLLNVEEVEVHVIGPGDQSEIDEILEHAKASDLVFFLSRDISAYPAQGIVAKALAKALPPQQLIFAGLSNPWELADLELHKTHLVYLTYSQAPSSLIALAKALGHHLLPPGKLYPLFEKADPCENTVCSTREEIHD